MARRRATQAPKLLWVAHSASLSSSHGKFSSAELAQVPLVIVSKDTPPDAGAGAGAAGQLQIFCRIDVEGEEGFALK